VAIAGLAGVAVALSMSILPSVLSLESWSMGTRMLAWGGLIDLVGDRWLLGLGLGSYWHYWRDVVGEFAYLDPRTGFFHYTLDPKVNMHNNILDIYGQMGLLGVLVFGWLLAALGRQVLEGLRNETTPFGRAYYAACAAGLVGMAFAAMLGDWILPFVYNVGLDGFRESYVGWLLLGGMTLLAATRERAASETGEGDG
jgi:O-antigen ligase